MWIGTFSSCWFLEIQNTVAKPPDAFALLRFSAISFFLSALYFSFVD